MAKDLKAKEPKKKGRRLKRTIRRTLGTMCLISAILVASIPTEGLKQVAAVDLNEKINEKAIADYLKGSDNEIPDLKNYTGEIYNSGNGFQFAFVSSKGDASGDDRMAVIIGFSENAASLSGTLSGGTLTIPVQLDAYLNYTTTDGNYGFVAVSKDNTFLFYEASPEEKDASTGEVVAPAVYRPCYFSDVNIWSKFDDKELYYETKDASGITTYVQVGSGNDNKMRIKNAQVRYIGNQYLAGTEGTDTNKKYIIKDTDETNRVFGNISNVNTLKIDADLYGIGNYAFYSCGSLHEIKLNSSLGYIGNYAFAGCNNMSTANLDQDMRLKAIGVSAFENCQALDSFLVPHNVEIIGDRAFKGCAGDTTGLRTIDLRGGGANPSLKQIGCELFVNCNKLTSITFPGSLTENVDISNFEGCTSLQYIAVSSRNTNITEGGKATFGYKEFQRQYNESSVIQGTFYFEGPSSELNPSVLHQTARDNYFAFSYLNDSTLESMNLYELTMDAGDTAGKDIKATYRVNDQNVLVSTKLDNNITKIILPNHIGPYYIATIDANVFQDYCYVTQLTVPATVRQINANAFSGCHNLEYVLFESPESLKIADGAFRTQNVGIHKCSDKTLDKNPKLTFIGPISENSEPFNYAMRDSNKINVGDQNPTYITFFSGWPTGLVVQHNPDTGKNELKDYPTLGDLQTPGSSYMYETYKAIDSEIAEKYRDAMSHADSTGTGYEREIWDAVMNITLPVGIDGIEAGLFKKKEADSGESVYLPSKTYKTLTAYGLKEVAGDDPDVEEDTGCFANCTTFSRIALYGDTVSIGDYAFKGCKNLTSVTVPNTVTTIGKIPFTGCENLANVDFQGSSYFECYNSIIYQLDTAGNRYKLIEYLEGRSSRSITEEDVKGLSEIAEEAFAGTSVSYVDLASTNVGVIPAKAFAGCKYLSSVILPNSVRSVESQAFTRCPNLLRLEVPNLNTVFRVDAVDTEDVGNPEDPDSKIRPDGLVFVCKEASMAAEYAKTYDFPIDPNGVKVYCYVRFENWDGEILKEEYVIQGQAATPPAKNPTRDGWEFAGWNKDFESVTEDPFIITAVFDKPEAKKVIVTFLDDDLETVLYTREVTVGKKVDLPPEPKKDGYVFIGWIGGDLEAPITEATSFVAKWEAVDGRFVVRFINDDGSILNQQLVYPGEDAYEPKTPEPQLEEHAGYVFAGWVPSVFTNVTKDLDIYATYTKDGSSSGDVSGGNGSGGNGSGGNGSGGNGSGGNGSGGNGSGGSGSDDTETVLYTLSVINGSGSGSYVAGSQPVIVANNPPSGQEFSNWTIEPADTKIASTVLSATVVTMPERNVTVTAHYKTKTGSSSGSSTVSGNNSNRPNSNSGTMSSGTTVVIDKNGLSNTGVVSATVRGSSDNYTIKITESSAASEAVLKALQAEYGDISNIKYFPMDITLYDSTGTKKITDTTGLSVTITLPLPDSLITYAGNNKVAGVVNNRLDRLSPKFTTIDKVACVTFTAEHFSPYVIYVETDHLMEGSVIDYTPKTGDGIHPKWFLSIGLACIAVVLFMKKDKRSLQKVKAA